MLSLCTLHGKGIKCSSYELRVDIISPADKTCPIKNSKVFCPLGDSIQIHKWGLKVFILSIQTYNSCI